MIKLTTKTLSQAIKSTFKNVSVNTPFHKNLLLAIHFIEDDIVPGIECLKAILEEEKNIF
jgi:hypothetical protein